MALTYSTGMTFASAADSATNWYMVRLSGSGSPPAFGGTDTTVRREGSASNSMKVASTNNDVVMFLDWFTNTEGGKSASTAVDLTASGNEVIAFWVEASRVAERDYLTDVLDHYGISHESNGRRIEGANRDLSRITQSAPAIGDD